MITLKTLHLATRQEVFDQVAKHLLTQNKKSKARNNRSCKYKGHGGLSCAAGNLITDEEYDPDIERRNWARLVSKKYVPGEHSNLIRDLQIVHDHSESPHWGKQLKRLANKYNLEYKF